jgi:alpha-ribazole phosphatase
MRIALIRHLAPLIAPGICYGRLDIAVDPSAHGQMSRIASDRGLHGAKRVWTSPAIRCRNLAEAITTTLAVPLSVDHRLLELDFGAWEGQTWDEIGRAGLDEWARSVLAFAPPGGESGADLIARIRDVHTELRRLGQDCVIVSHGGPLKILQALLLGKPIDLLAAAPPIGSVTHVSCRPFNWENRAGECGK